MTRRTPLRRINLQFSQIRFTEARTFMVSPLSRTRKNSQAVCRWMGIYLQTLLLETTLPTCTSALGRTAGSTTQ